MLLRSAAAWGGVVVFLLHPAAAFLLPTRKLLLQSGRSPTSSSHVSPLPLARSGGPGDGGKQPPGSGGGDGNEGDEEGPGWASAVALVAAARDTISEAADGEEGARRGSGRRQQELAIAWPKIELPRMPWQRPREPAADTAEKKPEEEQIPSFVVEDVAVKGTDLVPRDVLSTAAVASGLLGSRCGAEELRTCAEYINGWYQANGYRLSKVAQVHMYPETGSVVFRAEEPRVSAANPVHLTYLQRVNATDPQSPLRPRPKGGKTRAETVAKGLGLKPGEHFRIDEERWRAVAGSGLFDGAQMAGAILDDKGGVTLDVAVLERKSIVFEPGVTKNIFDSNWAGEVLFEERNLFGRNCVLGLNLRRSMRSPLTSCSVRLGSNRFSRAGAWNVEAFRDLVSGGGGSSGLFGGGGGGSSGMFSGVSRDLKVLARTLMAAQQGQEAATADREAAAAGAASNEGGGDASDVSDGAAAAAAATAAAAPAPKRAPGPSKRQGMAVQAQWRFRALSGSVGAQLKQVASLYSQGREDVISLSGRMEHRRLVRSRPLRLPRLPRIRRGESNAASPASNTDLQNSDSSDLEADDEALGRDIDPAAMDAVLQGSGEEFLAEEARRAPRKGVQPRRQQQRPGGGGGGGRGGGQQQEQQQQPYAQIYASLDAKNGVVLDELQGSMDPFLQVGSTFIQKVPLGSGLVAMRQRAVLSTASTPSYELSSIGGQHTVRGFAEGGLGIPKSALMGTAEVRFPLPAPFLGNTGVEAVLFMDGAAYTNFQRKKRPPPAASVHGANSGSAARWAAAGSGGGSGGGAPAQEEGNAGGSEGKWTESGEALRPAVLGRGGAGSGSGAGGRADVRVTSGVGLRIGGLIKVDVTFSGEGIQQVHLGLVDGQF